MELSINYQEIDLAGLVKLIALINWRLKSGSSFREVSVNMSCVQCTKMIIRTVNCDVSKRIKDT